MKQKSVTTFGDFPDCWCTFTNIGNEKIDGTFYNCVNEDTDDKFYKIGNDNTGGTFYNIDNENTDDIYYNIGNDLGARLYGTRQAAQHAAVRYAARQQRLYGVTHDSRLW